MLVMINFTLDSDEQTRRDTVFNRVTTILRLKGSNIPSMDADGCVLAPAGAALAIVVFQNEITDISAHPHAQAVGRYSHLLDKCPDDLKTRWRFPSLAITIVGK